MGFGTMYIASTGLQALSTGMGVISNNLANANTVGYKTMRTNYQDLISECYRSGGNHNQLGKGAKVGNIQSMFTQGAYRGGGHDTDMAIAGEGFFSVSHNYTGEVMYTRAGVYSWDVDGNLEDPSHNILQGWKMSVPKPGEEPVRMGNPVDINITSKIAPPVATTEVRLASNLDAGATSSYDYPAFAQADGAAKAKAALEAEIARLEALHAIWNPQSSGNTVGDVPITTSATHTTSGGVATSATSAIVLKPSNNETFNVDFIDNYNQLYGTTFPSGSASIIENMTIVSAVTTSGRANGEMTQAEFDDLINQTTKEISERATIAGQSAYDTTYETVYNETYKELAEDLEGGWQWEGNGYAGAWDSREKPPMGDDEYTYSEPLTVYDSAGTEHTLMVYYQKNPHMENIWDYVVTSDPVTDARLGNAGPMFASDASFTGLLQKGKLTFTADDEPPLKAGIIKSMEAQNIDLAGSLAAVLDDPKFDGGASSAMQTATFTGSYYTGSSAIDPQTGQPTSKERTYTLTWGVQDSVTGNWSPNTNSTPPKSAMTWTDSDGNTDIIIVDPKYPGPYNFGSGMSVTFENGGLPMNFGAPGSDSMTVVAHSEQISWTEAAPNEDGYFDLNLSFVDATAGLTPPYPVDAPALDQTVAFNQGAKSSGGNVWVPTSGATTTQYASESTVADKKQDGYPESTLERFFVRDDGMLVGIYGPKNREIDLYQVAITRFNNLHGLDKQGNNLFGWNEVAGEPRTGVAYEGGNGQILGSYLEQSNVDTATEIVTMILTQRGFQANSKVITTTDTVISTAIQIKK